MFIVYVHVMFKAYFIPSQSGQSVHPEMEAEKKMAPPTSDSPLVKIKDEPMDEEYEKALGSQAPAGKIKEEPDTSEVSSSLHFS